MSNASVFYPAQQLSMPGNLEEFSIPNTPLGRAVAGFRMVWAKVEGNIQPCIFHPGVRYPGFQPVTAKEVYGR